MNTRDTLLLAWASWHDVLVDLYRVARQEKEQGLDRESTRNAIDRAERAEHEAWLAYRGSDGM